MHAREEHRWPEKVMSDLKPCPNCGSERVMPDLVHDRSGRGWQVVCPSCRTRRPHGSSAQGFEDAVARWNEQR
jgi:hypothetical protein